MVAKIAGCPFIMLSDKNEIYKIIKAIHSDTIILEPEEEILFNIRTSPNI